MTISGLPSQVMKRSNSEGNKSTPFASATRSPDYLLPTGRGFVFDARRVCALQRFGRSNPAHVFRTTIICWRGVWWKDLKMCERYRFFVCMQHAKGNGKRPFVTRGREPVSIHASGITRVVMWVFFGWLGLESSWEYLVHGQPDKGLQDMPSTLGLWVSP